MSNNILSLEKVFFSYVNNYKDDIQPLFIKLPKLNRTIKNFEKVKSMSFMLEESYDDN